MEKSKALKQGRMSGAQGNLGFLAAHLLAITTRLLAKLRTYQFLLCRMCFKNNFDSSDSLFSLRLSGFILRSGNFLPDPFYPLVYSRYLPNLEFCNLYSSMSNASEQNVRSERYISSDLCPTCSRPASGFVRDFPKKCRRFPKEDPKKSRTSRM